MVMVVLFTALIPDNCCSIITLHETRSACPPSLPLKSIPSVPAAPAPAPPPPPCWLVEVLPCCAWESLALRIISALSASTSAYRATARSELLPAVALLPAQLPRRQRSEPDTRSGYSDTASQRGDSGSSGATCGNRMLFECFPYVCPEPVLVK